MGIETGDVVICVVEKIIGTNVFVNIKGLNAQGTITLSEVAPGRIRNLRDYVVPKKTIVCKVLRVKPDHIELSLRRVKEKEKKEILEESKIEQSYAKILKTILQDKTPEIIKKIEEQATMKLFLDKAKENPRELERIVGKVDSKKIIDILNNQKQKTVTIKKEINFYSDKENGLSLLKEILSENGDIEVNYVSAGRYSLKTEGKDLKEGDKKLKEFIVKIEDFSKRNQMIFSEKN